MSADTPLFDASVADNVRLWGDDATGARISAALERAAVLDVVLGREGGTSHVVARGGAEFSGGERQRMALARALLAEPDVLLLDGATDALDPALERRILDRLRAEGRTVVLATQRSTTLRACDRVVVLDGGQVVEDGAPEILLGAEGSLVRWVAAS